MRGFVALCGGRWLIFNFGRLACSTWRGKESGGSDLRTCAETSSSRRATESTPPLTPTTSASPGRRPQRFCIAWEFRIIDRSAQLGQIRGETDLIFSERGIFLDYLEDSFHKVVVFPRVIEVRAESPRLCYSFDTRLWFRFSTTLLRIYAECADPGTVRNSGKIMRLIDPYGTVFPI
jgi:hypothetical protein